MQKALTKKTLEALKPQAKRYEVHDGVEVLQTRKGFRFNNLPQMRCDLSLNFRHPIFDVTVINSMCFNSIEISLATDISDQGGERFL